MAGQPIDVVWDNSYHGQIVSGSRKEEKNVDLRIRKSRNTLFGLLGPAFSFKCLLSPVVKLHIYRTFVCPVLRSGISSLVIKDTSLSPLSIFQRKSLKGVLQLNKQTSTPYISLLENFEVKIHKDIFSLFYSVWTNPNTKIFTIVKYLLSSSNSNSKTWSNHLRYLAKQYGLEDPLKLIMMDPQSKSSFKNDVSTRINSFHENELRKHEDPSQKLKYFNVSVIGLSGRYHPALSGLFTVTDMKKSRHHLKMLVGDLFTYEKKSEQSGGSPDCRLCLDNKRESVSHILTFCSAYSDIRTRILQEFAYLCMSSKSDVDFSSMIEDNEVLCQFILDPTSMNLSKRIHMNDPLIHSFFKTSRDLCFGISELRLKLLREKENKLNSEQ